MAVIVVGEPTSGMKRDDVFGWRGKYLQASMTHRWGKGRTRDAVVADLLDTLYYISVDDTVYLACSCGYDRGLRPVI